MADENNDLTRRDFVALSLAAGIAAAAGEQLVSAADVDVHDVSVKTPDGMCDCAFVHPSSGSHPAVIIWPDAFGLRPAMVDMGKRIAADGYSVLVPNPYYRLTKAPGVDANGFNFSNQADMAKLRPLMASIGAAGAAEKDVPAFITFLDAQKPVNKTKKFGTQGYCMGGPLVFRTMAAAPERMGAGGSFHGGGLVTDQPTSPHLLIPKMKGRLYVAIASNDDQRQPDAKDKLKDAFAAAKVPAEIEVYKSLHGWCVPDMPAPDADHPIYNKPEAEKAWAKLVALYKTALV
jgi:carboxymethylenebutenolidase